jgi:hypothetical protein
MVYNLTEGRVKQTNFKMKKSLFTAFAVGLGLTVNVMAQVPSYVPTNGLVGWWPFNGNANDESGNGNNGTVNGATLTADRNGVANKAYSFNSSSYIAVAHNNTFNMQQATWSVWVKKNSSTTGNGMYIFGKRDNAQHQVTFCAGNTGNMQIGWASGQAIGINGGNIVSSWHMLTITYDQTIPSSNVSFYYDGILQGTSTIQPFSFLNGDLRFGIEVNNSYWQAFNGLIDEGLIYNRVLSGSEILQLYNGCSNPTATITPQGSTTFCSGDSVNLNASIGNVYTYQWYRNGTLISNATANSYAATLAGNYTVVVSSNGCSSTSAATTITVNPNPSVTLTGLNGVTNFYTSPISLIGSPSGGVYSGSGVTGNSFNPSIAGLGVKSVNYSYTTAAGCNGNATQSTIIFDTLGVVCTSYDTVTTNITIYDTLTTTIFDTTYITVSDTLLTTVTDTLIINTTLSLPAPNNENTILIYPNPASDHITIDNGNFAAMAGYSIKIENNAGQQVFQSVINQQQFYVDLSTWSGNGLYFVHLIDPQNNTVTVRKIVLQ